jgi:hypothetical protein
MNNNSIDILASVDDYHKNCSLLFSDLVATIRQKTLAQGITDLLLEGGYWLWDSNDSEHKRRFVFEYNGCTRFCMMLVKTKESEIQNSPGYRTACEQLCVNIFFPQLLIIGKFNIADIKTFQGDLWLKRSWVDCVLLLNFDQSVEVKKPNPYKFDKVLSIRSQSKNQGWIRSAEFKIYLLSNIKDSAVLGTVADDLLKM